MSKELHKQVDRRRDILEAAEKVFGMKGYASASIDSIAAEAGVSKGSIYNYFKSKDDLFVKLFIEDMDGIRAQIQTAIAKDISAHDKLDELFDLSFQRVVSEHKELCRLVLEFWVGAARQGTGGELFEIVDGLYTWYRNILVDVLKYGVQQGEFELIHEPDVVATLLMAVMDGLWLQSLVGVVSGIGNEHLEALKQAVFTTLSAEINDKG